MSNLSPKTSTYSWDKPFPIIGEINPNALTQRVNLIGDTEGEKSGYPVGLVCVLDLTTMKATPLAGAISAGSTLGILMDQVDDLSDTTTSSQQFNFVYRNVTINKQALVVRPLGSIEDVVTHFEHKQNCGIIN